MLTKPTPEQPSEADAVRARLAELGLPKNYPTHQHEPEFWEQLGRTVATFGYLEIVMGRAIFALTATTEFSAEDISDEDVERAVKKFEDKINTALYNTLNPLIDLYINAVKENKKASREKLPELEEDLRNVAQIRNVLCHGCWQPPDINGASRPFFVKKTKDGPIKFQDSIDVNYLKNVRHGCVLISKYIIDMITNMGLQFPGTKGPGKSVWPSKWGIDEDDVADAVKWARRRERKAAG